MKLAVMLMIVVLVFLICNVLPFIVNIMELFSISYKPLTGERKRKNLSRARGEKGVKLIKFWNLQQFTAIVNVER